MPAVVITSTVSSRVKCKEEVEFGGEDRGAELAFDGDDVQVPVVDVQDVSGGELCGGDFHGGPRGSVRRSGG
jgi:hypothetical protein